MACCCSRNVHGHILHGTHPDCNHYREVFQRNVVREARLKEKGLVLGELLIGKHSSQFAITISIFFRSTWAFFALPLP